MNVRFTKMIRESIIPETMKAIYDGLQRDNSVIIEILGCQSVAPIKSLIYDYFKGFTINCIDGLRDTSGGRDGKVIVIVNDFIRTSGDLGKYAKLKINGGDTSKPLEPSYDVLSNFKYGQKKVAQKAPAEFLEGITDPEDVLRMNQGRKSDPTVPKKICPICNKVKDSSDFYECKRKKVGIPTLELYCKDCQSVYMRWRAWNIKRGTPLGKGHKRLSLDFYMWCEQQLEMAKAKQYAPYQRTPPAKMERMLSAVIEGQKENIARMKQEAGVQPSVTPTPTAAVEPEVAMKSVVELPPLPKVSEVPEKDKWDVAMLTVLRKLFGIKDTRSAKELFEAGEIPTLPE